MLTAHGVNADFLCLSLKNAGERHRARNRRAFALAGIERTTIMEKASCEFKDKIYPHGSVTCIGDQCIQCREGHWGPNEFEVELREAMLANL